MWCQRLQRRLDWHHTLVVKKKMMTPCAQLVCNAGVESVLCRTNFVLAQRFKDSMLVPAAVAINAAAAQCRFAAWAEVSFQMQAQLLLDVLQVGCTFI